MTAFQQFRLWLREGTVASRVTAGLAGALFVALIGLLLVPGGKDHAADVEATAGDSQTTATTTAGPASPSGSPTSSLPGANSGGGPQGSAQSPGGTAGTPVTVAGTSCPSSSEQGLTATEIKIALILIDLSGPVANNAFGVPTTDDQEAAYRTVADSINSGGGVACRKLVLSFFHVNPADPSNQQAQCLAVDAAKPFAVVDPGAFGESATASCIPSHKLPFFGYAPNAADAAKNFPYHFGLMNQDLANRNGILGLGKIGAFDPAKGFQKLGFIYRSCFPDFINTMHQAIRAAGVTPDRLSEYDVGCPSSFTSPADLQQAVLKFRRDGVTHVTTGGFLADFANFTKVAQQQGFKPKYVLSDSSIAVTASGALAPDANNLDGAVLVTEGRYGEENTPGFVPSSGTVKCNAIFAAKGQPPVYKQMSGFGGRACDQLWMLQAAIAHAPRLERAALVDGLHATRSVDFSFPYGPNDFTPPRVTHGGEFWRPIQFSAGCTCWRVVDVTFQPSFR